MTLMLIREINIADQIEKLKGQILDRWREEVRKDPVQAASTHNLANGELEDHLPALTEKIIKSFRGEPVTDLEADAASHGLQRRQNGFTVVALLRELQIFRRVLVAMVKEIVGAGGSDEGVDKKRDLLDDIVDRSMNVSVLQYTLAAEEERNSAQGEAKELHRQRDRFLATLSHELRNQVSPILLGAQLLKDLRPSDQQMKTLVERIERQARHQSILIDDLLDISRFRYGKLQLKRDILDLRVPIQRGVETFQSDFSAKNINVEVHLPPQPLNASVDETRITQVLVNLLQNAIKFTPQGGTITVGLTEIADAAIFSVKDTGVGISDELLPHLFTMFFQTEEPSTPVKTGLGVGLALAKLLVDMHDGTIQAHSEGLGKGAEFTVRIPIAKELLNKKSSSLARTVLIVDDNPDHLHFLAELLRMRDYEVVEANNAIQALSLSAEHKPNACVIDIGLPDMNGYDLARKLRESPETCSARLVAVTGYGTKADKQTFKEAGFDHYFPKPLHIDELNAVLSN
jgi:signal transduction histidine kinase